MNIGMVIIWFFLFCMSVVILGLSAIIIAKCVKIIIKMFNEEKDIDNK